MITTRPPNHHWNYFLAIEKDLETVSKYIEFSEDNFSTYSIALTHILLSASSEVDVIMKQLCALLDADYKTENIDQYRKVINDKLPLFRYEEVTINRFGMVLNPWNNWLTEENPDWWRSYNNVKHQRNNFYREANLKNTLNAVGALLVTVIYFYKTSFKIEKGKDIDFTVTTAILRTKSTLMKLNTKYYFKNFDGLVGY